MTHYNLLKLKPGADAGAIFAQCEAVYAALEAELPQAVRAAAAPQAAATVRKERRVILRIMIYLLYLFAYAAYRCRARKHSLVCETRTVSLYTREV